MNYAELKARGFMIGSGVVEAACKTLVTQRLKQSGMRWSVPGAQAILTGECPFNLWRVPSIPSPCSGAASEISRKTTVSPPQSQAMGWPKTYAGDDAPEEMLGLARRLVPMLWAGDQPAAAALRAQHARASVRPEPARYSGRSGTRASRRSLLHRASPSHREGRGDPSETSHGLTSSAMCR